MKKEEEGDVIRVTHCWKKTIAHPATRYAHTIKYTTAHTRVFVHGVKVHLPLSHLLVEC